MFYGKTYLKKYFKLISVMNIHNTFFTSIKYLGTYKIVPKPKRNHVPSHPYQRLPRTNVKRFPFCHGIPSPWNRNEPRDSPDKFQGTHPGETLHPLTEWDPTELGRSNRQTNYPQTRFSQSVNSDTGKVLLKNSGNISVFPKLRLM